MAGYLGLDARAMAYQQAGAQWRAAVASATNFDGGSRLQRAVVEADMRQQIAYEAEVAAAEAARAQALLSDGLGASGRFGYMGRGR